MRVQGRKGPSDAGKRGHVPTIVSRVNNADASANKNGEQSGILTTYCHFQPYLSVAWGGNSNHPLWFW